MCFETAPAYALSCFTATAAAAAAASAAAVANAAAAASAGDDNNGLTMKTVCFEGSAARGPREALEGVVMY